MGPKSEWVMSYLSKKLNFCFKAKLLISHYPFTFWAHDHMPPLILNDKPTHTVDGQKVQDEAISHCIPWVHTIYKYHLFYKKLIL